MEWTDHELDELATFFAKRMTPELKLLDPSDPPPPGDPSAAWRTRLRTARDRGELPALARSVAAADRSDANLQQACSLLEGPAGGRNTLQVLGAALSVGALMFLVGVGVVGLAVRSSSAPHAEALVPVEAPLARRTGPATPTPDPDLARIQAPLAPDAVEEAPVEVAQAVPSSPTPPAQRANARCGGSDGAIVGYWYAGTDKPGAKGGRVVLDRTVNVRADYPDVHNGFEKRSEVRCVLVAGDKIRLAKAPVKVPGDAWWVPLVAGTVEPG